MNINTRAKALIGAVAIGGAAIAMGGAFTAGGLTATGGASQGVFIGGEVSQSVTGAELTSVTYVVDNVDDPDAVTSIDLVFSAGSDVDTKVPTVEINDSGTKINCDAVASQQTTCALTATSVGDISTLAIAVPSTTGALSTPTP